MLCKAVNKWRGVEFTPEIDPENPFATMDACHTYFASELHTKQVEIVVDREFYSAIESYALSHPDTVFKPIEAGDKHLPSYNDIPIVIIGEPT